ncbi:MAG TPA: hypothetical protein VGC30_06290 [Dokdonella sp.]
MRGLAGLVLAGLLGIGMGTSDAEETPHTPPPGSPERAAVLDAARAPVQSELGKPVQFVVKRLAVLGPWAFVHAAMQSSGGQPVDYVGTRYEDAALRGHKSSSYAALLKRRGEVWEIVNYSIGPTDVAWQTWADQYKAPPALFEAGP